MNLKNKLALIAILLFNIAVLSQTKTVTGQVVSASDNLPVPGVNVVVMNTSRGTTTDFDGGFKIDLKSGEVLQFSFLGFVTQVQIIKDQKTIKISLVEDIAKLDEVVVVGYGSLKKSNITSSVSTYKNENMDQMPVSRVDQALQGKIAGVQIQNTSSAAGESPVIRIRGQASIFASPDPLIVVDGQPIDDGLASINMADVQDISVLKDASSSAIYGSRGANGVILLTTKSGSSKKTVYSFNNSVGIKSPYELYDVQTSSEYVKQLYAERELRLNDPLWSGTVPIVPTGYQKQYIFEQMYLNGKGTDYQDEFMRTGIFRNIGLSASGGSKAFTYRISGAYNGDESMMQKSNYDKYQFRLKMNVDLNEKLSVGVNIAPTYSETERPANDYRDYYRFPTYIPVKHTAETLAFIQTAAGGNPGVNIGDYANPQHFYNIAFPNYIMPDGSNYTSTSTASPWTTTSINPFKVLNLQDDTQEDFRIQSSFDLTYKITKDLTFKTTANAYYRYNDRLQWVGTNANAESNSNFAVYTRNNTRDLLTENTLNYVKVFDKHSFNVLAGFSAQRSDYYYSSFQGNNYANENIRTFNNATTITLANNLSTSAVVGEVKNATSLLSYYGRIVYSYDGLFNVTGTIRKDGASQFGPGNKWGSFPSVSAGVNLAKLDFIQSSDVISKLNFRAAYGETGNNRTDRLPTRNAFNPYLNILENNNYVSGSGNGTSVSGQVTPNAVGANVDITWETTVSANLGFDLSMFRNRLNLSADFYESNTDKLLLQTNNQLFSGTALSWNNVGSLRNRGHEIELSTTNIRTENFKWTTTANYASNRLKLTDFGGLAETPTTGERGELYITKVGSPLVQFYGYKTDGVWLSQAEIDASGFTAANVSIGTLTPGALKLVDVSGDGKINAEDRTIIGDPYADFTWGITNTLEYKSIDLSFSFQGVQGIEMYQGDTGYNETRRQVLNYTQNRWVSPSNPGDGLTPFETNGGIHWVLTDYGIDDASYVALREVTLGYNLNEKWAKQIGLNQLRMYFTGQNMLYLTAKSFRGINPESRRTGGTYASSLVTGYDRGGYPVPKTLVLGIDVKF
jgi:TonB-linked SusC/RagA family outer membrane protein